MALILLALLTSFMIIIRKTTFTAEVVANNLVSVVTKQSLTKPQLCKYRNLIQVISYRMKSMCSNFGKDAHALSVMIYRVGQLK